MKKAITAIVCAGALAGCSNIATVNGIPVGDNTTVSTQNMPSYCQENRAMCIIGGALAAGALVYLVNQNDDEPDACEAERC